MDRSKSQIVTEVKMASNNSSEATSTSSSTPTSTSMSASTSTSMSFASPDSLFPEISSRSDETKHVSTSETIGKYLVYTSWGVTGTALACGLSYYCVNMLKQTKVSDLKEKFQFVIDASKTAGKVTTAFAFPAFLTHCVWSYHKKRITASPQYEYFPIYFSLLGLGAATYQYLWETK